MEDCELSDAVAEAEQHVIRWRYKDRSKYSYVQNGPDEILIRWLSICYGIEIELYTAMLRSSAGDEIGYDHCWKVTRVRDPEKAIMFKLRF
jgi:hypothetical protein